MSPPTFLLHSKTVSAVRQKARLPSINNYQAKQICLDPVALSTDATIESYSDRMEQILPDRRNLQVILPFEEAWFGIQKSVTVR